jgi:hypothetical protein
MKNESIVIRLFYIFVPLLFVGTLVGQNISCPNGISSSGFKMFLYWGNGNVTPPSGTQIQINLFDDDNNNLCTQLVSFTPLLTDPLTFYGNASCGILDNNGSLTISGQVCYYEEGKLVSWPVNPPTNPMDCEKNLEECPNIMAFATEFYNPPTECKQWNGPCNSQSEISRPGKVSVGTKKFANEFQLTVKGGITTEQLKVCKNEWCDYVFADIFLLMNLTMVR